MERLPATSAHPNGSLTPPDPNRAKGLATLLSADELTPLLGSLNANQYRYVAARLRDPEHPKAAILRSLGLARNALYRWRNGGSFAPASAALRALDDAIDAGKPILREQVAMEILRNHAPAVALGLVQDAMAEVATDRQRQMRHQAQVKVLEAANVLKARSDGHSMGGDQVQVNIILEQPPPGTIPVSGR